MQILKPAAIISASSIAVLLSAISNGAAPSLAAGPSSSWSQTSYNAAHSRANLTEQTLTPSAVANVRFLRSVDAPPTPPGSLCGLAPVTAPLLTGGNIYAITNNRISKYTNGGRLIWRRNPDPQFITEFISLAVAKGLVVTGGFGCESPSEPGGFVDAFNASTGAPVWSQFFDSLDQMVVAGSHVVMTGGSADGTLLVVLNLSDGSLLWGNTDCVSGQAVFVVAQLVVETGCGSSGSGLNAYKIATGALAWSRPGAWTPQGGDLSGPAARHFYATDSSGTVTGLDPLTGHTQYTLSQAVGVLAVDQARVYATCGGQDVCAYNISTGALEWQAPGGTAAQHARAPSPPHVLALQTDIPAAEADGVLYLNSGRVLNAATGKRIKRLGEATALAVGDGHIAVVSDPRVLDLYGLKGS